MSGINEIETVKKTGPCYKFRGPHFHCECTSNSNNKFQNKTTQQAHKKPIMQINFATTEQATICFPWEHCLSRCPYQ